MKKINSINISIQILNIILIFMVIIPLIGLGFKQMGFVKTGSNIIVVSLIIGTVIFVISFVLLMLELRQDYKLDQYFTKHRNLKIKLSTGKYECQNCGNKQVYADDVLCSVCGIHFEEYHDRPPYL